GEIAVEAFLQAGQPYPGDNHVQNDSRFLVYQTSDTEHVVLDNMTDTDTFISSSDIRDLDFDVIAWYAGERRRAFGL
ncbi:hypothetical protein C8F04DRAFT_892093, partial [Mycena alexandri]